jgi:hypothetical protein
MDKHGGREDLHGSDRRSVILYVHGEMCCIVVLLKPMFECVQESVNGTVVSRGLL